MRRPAGVPASASIVSSALMVLLASGMLAFAWIYYTVHTPNPPQMGIAAPQPTDSATVLPRLDVPPPPPTTVPVVPPDPPRRALPPAAPRAAPRPSLRAVPRSTAPAQSAAPKWAAAPRPPLFVPVPPPPAPPPRAEAPDPTNPYDDTPTEPRLVDAGL